MFELTLVKRRRRASHVTSLKRALKVIQAWRFSNVPQTWPPWNVPQTCSIRAADVRQTCRKGDSTRFKSDVLQTWRASNVRCLKSSVPRIGCKRASPVLHTYLTMLQTRFKRASNTLQTHFKQRLLYNLVIKDLASCMYPHQSFWLILVCR